MTGEASEGDLRDCPFCGGHAQRKADPGTIGERFGLVVDHDPSCFMMMLGVESNAAFDAAWNTRTTPANAAPSDGEVENVGLKIAERIRQEMISGRQWWLDGLDGRQRQEFESELSSTCVAIVEDELSALASPTTAQPKADGDKASPVAESVVEQVARAIYEADDPWHKAWAWGQSRDGIEDKVRDIARAAITAMPRPIEDETPTDAGEEYMTVTLSKEGTVTSHHAFDADWDEMVSATQKIIDALQERMAGRGHCPFARINAPSSHLPAQIEPIAWKYQNAKGGSFIVGERADHSQDWQEQGWRETPLYAHPTPTDAGESDKALMREDAVGVIARFIADVDDADRADAGLHPLMEAHIADFRAVLATPVEERAKGVVGSCSYCDGTGDVHRADGEWLGTCPCFTAALAATNAGQGEAVGWAKATAWHKYGVAWKHLERVSQEELLADAIEALNQQPHKESGEG